MVNANNNVQFIGRLTKDVDLKQTGTGVSVGSFTLAVQRNYKNAHGGYDADFINCVIWRQAAENLSKFAGKGNQISVVGSLQTRNFEGNDGKRVFITEVNVEGFGLLEKKNDTSQSKQSTQRPKQQSEKVEFDPNDLPF